MNPLIVIPDTNVLMHGKSLQELPWDEIAGSRPVEIALLTTTLKEIDKLKNETGRRSRLARDLSSKVREIIQGGGTKIIRQAPHQVVIKLHPRPAPWVSDDLEKGHADQELINHALSLQLNGAEVLLFTDDTICYHTAESVSVRAIFLKDEWRRPQEADPVEKENRELKAELLRLQTGPKIELQFLDQKGEPLERLEVTVPQWPPLSNGQIEDMMAEVAMCSPPASNFDRRKKSAFEKLIDYGPGSKVSYTEATAEEIEEYKTAVYPAWLDKVREALGRLHETLSEARKWPEVRLVAANVGVRPAENVLLSLTTKGLLEIVNGNVDEHEDEDHPVVIMRRDASFSLPAPPDVPRGRKRIINTLNILGLGFSNMQRVTDYHLPGVLGPPKHRTADAFYWNEGRDDWSIEMELECESWRHGRDGQQVIGVIRISEDAASGPLTGGVTASVHADNLSEPVHLLLPVVVNFISGDTLAEAWKAVRVLGPGSLGDLLG